MKRIRNFLILCFVFPLSTRSQILMGEDRSRYEFAIEKYNQAKYSQAVDYCTEIINGGTKTREVYKLRAMAYRSMSNYEKAADDYTEAIQHGGRDPQLYIDIAMVNVCQKDFDKAEIAMNEAIRLFKEQNGTEKNGFILEEMGIVNHYLGNYREAISYFREALEYGSTMAYIELLSLFFRNNDFERVWFYSDSLLRHHDARNYDLLTDSTLYSYVSTLNDLSKNAPTQQSIRNIERSLSSFKSADDRCFQGFYYDMLAVKAYVQFFLGEDSAAYDSYKKIYAANKLQPDIKSKIDLLKSKLKFDMVPPSIKIKNPTIDENGVVNFSATKTSYEMYAQVTDSSGVASVSVNNTPINKIEDDGLFVFNLELLPGKNDVIVTAIDKYDNKSEKRFIINNVVVQGSKSDDLADIPALVFNTTYHAILIAENDYQDAKFPGLVNPIKDVTELKNILVKNYVFDETNIMLLTNASKMDILDSIEKKCKALTDNDNLLIYYAGHGSIRKVGNNFEGAYLIPSDAKKEKWNTCINSNDLKESIKTTSAKHLLFIVDACFGGALLRSTMDDAPLNIKASYAHNSRKVLTSGNLEEVADNGKFIKNLKELLTTNLEKYISAWELATYIKKNSEGNTPQYYRIEGTDDMGGDFIFIKRSK